MYIECIRKWRELNEHEKQIIRNAAVQEADQFSSENFAGRVEQVYLTVLEEKRYMHAA